MSRESFGFPRIAVAAVQAAPAFLDLDRTIEIVADRTAEAVAGGADLVAFSEAFVPGFPTWTLVLSPTQQHGFTEILYQQAVEVPGRAASALGSIAADHGVILSVGVTERSRRSPGTMWNSNLVFGRDGSLLNHRRKLVPTWAEKLAWAYGDGFDLGAFDTPIGRLGVLICGENTNPLARFAMMDSGEQVHIAPYPPAWPTRKAADSGNYDLTHAVILRSSAHSFEGKLFTVAVSGLLADGELEAIAAVDASAAADLDAAPAPVSAVIGPDGRPVGDPLVGAEGILLRSIELDRAISAKQIHDVAGGYQRFDVFAFSVNHERRDMGPA